MLHRFITSILFSVLITLGFCSESYEELFKMGNKAYDNQQFDSSLYAYQKIESSGYSSPELFKNMGNASYKLGLIPEAIFYYEKSLKLNPGNNDLIHNLELANQRAIDQGNETEAIGIGGWISNLVGGNADYWSSISVLLSILGGVSFFGYLFIKSNIRKISSYLTIIFWTFSIICLGIGYLQLSIHAQKDYAILFEPSIEVKNDPSEAASIAFVLHEGCKLKILDENKDWYKISYGDEKIGWLPKTSLKVI